MLRRTLAVFSSLVVALLLMGTASSSRAAELYSVNINGSVSARLGETLTLNVYGYRYSNPGNVVNSILEGRCLVSGRINGQDVYIFSTNVRSVTVDARKTLGWMSVDYVFRSVPYTFYLEVTSGGTHGNAIRYWVLSQGKVVSSSSSTANVDFLRFTGACSITGRIW